jgi:hypothetical protein
MSQASRFIGIDRSLSDFHHWALSGLMSNTTRGMIAEYLVRHAMGLDHEPALEWDYVDIRSQTGTVEVKFSGFAQSWAQAKLSKPRFDIGRRAYAWDSTLSTWLAKEELRRANAYVFCLHHETNRQAANPLVLAQWSFGVLSTKRVDALFGNQRTIALPKLESVCEFRPFEQLAARISEALKESAASEAH